MLLDSLSKAVDSAVNQRHKYKTKKLLLLSRTSAKKYVWASVWKNPHTYFSISLRVCLCFFKETIIFPAIRSNFSTDGSVWILLTTCSKRKTGQSLELPIQIFRKFWNSGTGLGRYEWNIFRGCLFILDLHYLLTHDHPHIHLYVSGPTTEVRFASCHWNSTLTIFILYLFLWVLPFGILYLHFAVVEDRDLRVLLY